MENIIVCIAGDNIDNLFTGINKFSVESVVILANETQEEDAQNIKKKLESFKTPVNIRTVSGSWEDIFKEVNELKKSYGDKLIIDVSTGNPSETALLTSAAYVNGVKAYSVENNNVIMLPVLKFSYYKMVPDKKMRILKLLYQKSHCCSSFEDLSREMNMSLPLISYHINGSGKSKGLKELGLVETKESKNKIGVQLSLQGRLLVKGCL
ncbi:MAG: winged helix-turn-helix domain-containing protein [Candidatus Nanoarchaeia archaeon]